MALTMLLAAVAQGKSWMFSELADCSRPLAALVMVRMPALGIAFAAYRVKARIRRNLKDLYR